MTTDSPAEEGPAPAIELGVADRLNRLAPEALEAALRRCCASERWVAEVASRAPFRDSQAAFGAAEEVWWALEPRDWLEAFSAHPRIGAGELRERWTEQEQAGVEGATGTTLQALADGNDEYESRFGFIFLICASGLSADEMLAALRRRLENGPEDELRTAAAEQAAITRLRLARLVKED